MNRIALALDLGGTNLRLAAVGEDGTVYSRSRFETPKGSSGEDVIDLIVRLAENCRDGLADPLSVCAIAAAVPATINIEKGILNKLPNLRCLEGVPLRDILAKRLGIEAVLENDATAAAIGENWLGASRGVDTSICVTLGTGVGGGLILNGDLYRGSQFAAGEIGQVSVDYRGVDGPYGNFGALERYIGNQQITDLAACRYREAGRDFQEADCSPESLAQAAAAGDEIATGVWNEVAILLGTALASVVYLLNPDAIVIGGGVAHAGDVLFAPLRERMRSMLSFEFYESLKILPAELGNTAGIVGGAALAASAHS